MATLALLRLSPSPLPHRRISSQPPITSFPVRLPFHLRPASPIPSIPPKHRRNQSAAVPKAYGGQSTVPATDRLVAAAAYTLPLVDSLHYGRFLFARFPVVAAALAPILPVAAAYHRVPFASFVAFFGLYLGVVRNPNLSHYVRFNAMQAVVLDVLLALPGLVQRLLGVPAASRGIGFKLLEMGYNAIFVFSAACFLYSVSSCILGRTPYLPLVATAADRQL